MPEGSVISLVLQGGAVVALLMWIWDLREQRKHQDKLREQERAERIENASVMRETSQALGRLTNVVGAQIGEPPARAPRARP
jgi:hypothetical protein